MEDDITSTMKRVNELAGIKESDTGLAVPALWDIQADKQALQTEEPLQVHTYTHIHTHMCMLTCTCMHTHTHTHTHTHIRMLNVPVGIGSYL